MKGHAEAGGVRPGGAQQSGGLLGRRAEFAGEIVDRAALWQSQPHKQPQGRRVADQPKLHRFLHDLCQLVEAIERKIGHAPAVERLARSPGAP